MKFRILVTGSSGFVGSSVVSALAEDGHYVRAASRRPDKRVNERVEWVQLPDLRNEIDWNPFVADMDFVIHLAANAHRNLQDTDEYLAVNLFSTMNLAHTCRRQTVKRLIFASSIGAQTGPIADHIVTEADEPRPMTAYDRAKLAAEEAIKCSAVPHTILRPVVVYGPGAKANIASLMRISAFPLPLPLGAFKNQRSLLALDNLVQAVRFCIANPETINQTYIVCDREPISLADMIATLRRAAGKSPMLISVPPFVFKSMVSLAGRSALWDRMGGELVASSAKLQGAGWSPPIETRAGLGAMMKATLACDRVG
ncbi:NAD-dependent epimerase/dehydratase family protein [Bradyrhizobium sp. 200]|uniref:NAD-dependent epimerase/dehydratase family protein n=1 Tax=Bradyrhizobium sp. 200 TaxID=2782665 RepID=UPI001FFE3355|nr:NAD-dependent epimerase/dehydratase family protein [Bradyrhizobium sp. 200]UPJ51996.1 NAD-dependent epimerase/dehydratase family protein [Bradyrhizobium sp. 200]